MIKSWEVPEAPEGVHLLFADGTRQDLQVRYDGWHGADPSHGRYHWKVLLSQQESRAVLAGQASIRAHKLPSLTSIIADVDLGGLAEDAVTFRPWQPPNASIWMDRSGADEYLTKEQLERRRLQESMRKLPRWRRLRALP